jgi:ABC-2 type transport system permease protein
MKSAVMLVLKAKYRIVNNHLANLKKHILIHLFVGLGVLVVLIGGGTAFFYFIFDFLMHQEVFGPPLMERLFGMVMMAFFFMLIFSNLIITLSTTYISKEIDFYMGSPVRFHDIFVLKLIESIVYSSWAFAILSFPIFVAFGTARHVSLWFYPLTILLVVPFLVIPAGIGAILTMTFAAYFPARKTRLVFIILGAAAIGITVLLVRVLGARNILYSLDAGNFSQIMSLLQFGSLPILPNFWLTQGTVAAGAGHYANFIYWFLMLVSTALMCVQLCFWLIPKLYYRGWTLARESSAIAKGRRALLGFGLVDAILRPLRAPIRAFVSKDIKTFWRDPTQWTQLIMLFGLLFIYIGNIRSVATHTGTIDIFLPRWQTILSFFNMGATCFILSILTTRFVYPMLSLEGRQFWIIGLAPLKREHLVWEKYWMSWATALVITEALMIFSNVILNVSAFMMVLSTATILLMSFGLTSLAVGLGAMTPNFKEDNPARIANGLGGTLNVILSLIYVGFIIALELYPTYMYESGNYLAIASWKSYIIPYFAALLGINVVTIWLPMRLGLRRWRQIEF